MIQFRIRSKVNFYFLTLLGPGGCRFDQQQIKTVVAQRLLEINV